MSDLKDRAIMAYKEQQEDKAKKEANLFAKRIMATETTFKKKFGMHVSVKPGTCDIVLTKGGLQLRATFSANWSYPVSHFKLFGTCPECGIKCYSRPIATLAKLGEQIENFNPGRPHKCVSDIHLPTAGDTLLDAFRVFIYELGAEQ